MIDLLSTPPVSRIYRGASQSVRPSFLMLDPRLQSLAERIRRLIAESSFSAADVASALKVDKSAVSRWMSGQRTPTLQNLIDLAALLDVEMRELWEGPEAIPATPEQRAMLERMAQMTPEQQQAFLALASATLGTKPNA